jgi:CubicO group peptidase (beta-lactamase class C family)
MTIAGACDSRFEAVQEQCSWFLPWVRSKTLASIGIMYRPLALGGVADGVQLVDGAALAAMSAVAAASALDATLRVPARWALGLGKSMDNAACPPGDQEGVILSEDAFGHSGMGGSIGFADPRARMSFGYTMNRQGIGIGLDQRAQSLIDATYTALGYRRARTGSWFAAR